MITKSEFEEYLNQQEFEMRLSWFYYYKKWERDMDEVLTDMADKVCDYKTAEIYNKIANYFETTKREYMKTLE